MILQQAVVYPWRRWVRLVWIGWVLHAAAMVPTGFAGETTNQLVHLYFADVTRPFLVAEARVVIDPGDAAAFGRQLVAELIAGSKRGYLATLPKGTQLRSFFLLEDGTAVVDFSVHLRENHPGGCRLEQLTLFSVVNSLILNVDGIDRVKILIDGMEAQALTGHLPLDFPFTADMLLTR